MARPLRIEFPGAVYHVTSRGNAQADIYLDAADRLAFLDVLAEVVQRYGWLCHAYCLMDNHYHLLIETPHGELAAGMRRLNGRYTQNFNRRHRRVGHLLQGRYKAILVERDAYLLELCRYVVLNPVRAGMVKEAGAYAWSSYAATAGLAAPPAWLSTAWLLAQLAPSRTRAQARYRSFVAEGAARRSPWEHLRGQVILGGEEFVRQLEPLLVDAEPRAEVPRRQRHLARPGLAEIFGPGPDGTPSPRDRAIAEACLRHRYSQAEVARHLGLHYSTVSKVLARQRS